MSAFYLEYGVDPVVEIYLEPDALSKLEATLDGESVSVRS